MYINIRKILNKFFNIVYVVFVSLINYISILFIYLRLCILIRLNLLYLYNILLIIRQYCIN